MPTSAKTASNRAPILLAAVALVALLAGLFGQWFSFGIVTLVILVGCAQIGFGDSACEPRIRLTLAAYLALMVGLLSAIFHLHPMSDVTDLWLGLPPATAVLVYLFWPLQGIVGTLHIMEFSRTVMPEDRLNRFLAQHSKNRK